MENKGVSFGIEFPGVAVISILAVILISVAAWKKRSWSLGLMAVGGWLNGVERLKWGYVSDYWKIPGIPLYNNLNDWLIFIGLVCFIWQYRYRK